METGHGDSRPPAVQPLLPGPLLFLRLAEALLHPPSAFWVSCLPALAVLSPSLQSPSLPSPPPPAHISLLFHGPGTLQDAYSMVLGH